MTHIVSDRLVCGNCIQILDVSKDYIRHSFCAKHNTFVSKSDACCVGFTWSGEIAPDGHLLRFPRDVQSPIPLNA